MLFLSPSFQHFGWLNILNSIAMKACTHLSAKTEFRIEYFSVSSSLAVASRVFYLFCVTSKIPLTLRLFFVATNILAQQQLISVVSQFMFDVFFLLLSKTIFYLKLFFSVLSSVSMTAVCFTFDTWVARVRVSLSPLNSLDLRQETRLFSFRFFLSVFSCNLSTSFDSKYWQSLCCVNSLVRLLSMCVCVCGLLIYHVSTTMLSVVNAEKVSWQSRESIKVISKESSNIFIDIRMSLDSALASNVIEVRTTTNDNK